jgi:O-acetyl-ADP-ribose deacetylase (regulator of RNase III)
MGGVAVTHRVGDLFGQGLPALAHGVNCEGSMGGIAGQFARRWPALAEDYRERCANGQIVLGEVFTWTAPDGLVVYNLVTQPYPGPCAELFAIGTSLAAAVRHAEEHGIDQIGLPRIGAGIGGLEWDDVLAVIDEVGADTDVGLVVVSLG